MRLRLFVALLAVLAIAMPLAAQEQRASIEGVVRDTQGGALVGAAVTAKAAGGGSREVVTDATGTYRFVALAPGRYEVTAALSGFATAKVSNIDLRLGQVLSIPMTLAPGGMAETVQVVGESPLIDVKQSARATNLREEAIEKMPKGRDFTSLVTQAPGANQETKLGGISIDGASAVREPLHHRRRRDDRPALRHVGQAADHGLRRGGPGQVVRLRGRVRRRHRRRHQRDHEVRLEHVPRRRDDLLLLRRARLHLRADHGRRGRVLRRPREPSPQPDGHARRPSTSRTPRTTGRAGTPASTSAGRS